MKTLEEVKTHVFNVGYNQLAIQKIEGFLLGNGLLGEEFEMEYMIGERTFDDFRTWFNSKEEKKQEIDWSEFGFGDFIHIQDGVDVVLLGAVCDGKLVGLDNDRVRVLSLTDESRPCNESEVDEFERELRAKGVLFSFECNEFNPTQSSMCYNNEDVDKSINELDENYKELCAVVDSMSEDFPFKGLAKSITNVIGEMIDGVKEAEKNDSELIDELEIGAKEAIENIIANLHEGSMNEKEKERVVDALKVLVELGKMYE